MGTNICNTYNTSCGISLFRDQLVNDSQHWRVKGDMPVAIFAKDLVFKCLQGLVSPGKLWQGCFV